MSQEGTLLQRKSAHNRERFVDMYHTVQAYVIRMDLPGIRKEEVEVKLQNDGRCNKLVVSGKRVYQEPKPLKWHKAGVRRVYGPFLEELPIPTEAEVDTQGTRVDLQNGVLTVKLPKKRGAKMFYPELQTAKRLLEKKMSNTLDSKVLYPDYYDWYETEGYHVVELDIPDVTMEGLKLELRPDGILELQGHRNFIPEADTIEWIRVADTIPVDCIWSCILTDVQYYGPFRLELPAIDKVKAPLVAAKLCDGTLTITICKKKYPEAGSGAYESESGPEQDAVAIGASIIPIAN